MIVQARRKPILYEPPPGYYDLPFTWAYDASALTIGQNYPNQYIYMLGGYGDFICRRMVGLNRLLSTATGQFQIKDGQNNYLQSDPVYSVNVAPSASIFTTSTHPVQLRRNLRSLPFRVSVG